MDKTSLGSTIAALRKERGMTQLDLARQLGITDKAVSKWERGLSCPDLYTFPRLAEILGASVEELMQVSPAPSEPAGRTAALLSLIFRAVVCAMGAAVTSLAGRYGRAGYPHGFFPAGHRPFICRDCPFEGAE